MDSEPAVRVARRIAAEHFAHAGRMKLLRVDEVEHPPIGAWRGVALLALLVELLPLADHLRRHGLAHERLVDPVRAAVGADERGAVDPTEIRRNPDVVLLGEP